MAAIARGASSSTATPVLHLWVVSAAVLLAPYSIEFAVYDISTEDKRGAPVQVYPAPAGATAATRETGAAEPYALAHGQTILVKIDPTGSEQTLTLASSSFATGSRRTTSASRSSSRTRRRARSERPTTAVASGRSI